MGVFAAKAVFAADVSLSAEAKLPGISGIKPKILQVVPKIDANGNDLGWLSWTEVTMYQLNFGDLEHKTFSNPDPNGAPFQAFLAKHYFSVDMSYIYQGTGGANINQITVQYTEGEMPSGQIHGLGYKASIAFVRKAMISKTAEKPETEADTIGKYLLKDITGGRTVLLSSLAGGWLRLYIGIVSDPEKLGIIDAEVFSPGDVSGKYSGTIVIKIG